MKTDKVVLGILGGVAAGALLGILFAPEKGDKTRRRIMDKSNDYADELKDKLDTLLGTMTDKYEKIWKEGENLIAEDPTLQLDSPKLPRSLPKSLTEAEVEERSHDKPSDVSHVVREQPGD